MSKTNKTKQCRCLIRHTTDAAERANTIHNLKYFREIGDSNGIVIAMAQLGHCPSQS
jgi:hypothetical protein